MKRSIACCGLPAAVCCLIFVSSSLAHEFIIKPVQRRVESVVKLSFNILATRVWIARVENRIEQTTKDYDLYSLKAMLRTVS